MRLHRFALGAALALAPVLASAAPISGSVAVAGTDTFSSTGITFNPNTGIVLGESGTITGFMFSTATLTSFTTAAPDVTVFSATNTTGSTLSFTITGLSQFTTGTDVNGNADLLVAGMGNFAETGYTTTAGTFSLTSSSTGATSFQFNGGTAPEISASGAAEGLVLLLGGGLILRRGKLFGSETSEAL